MSVRPTQTGYIQVIQPRPILTKCAQHLCLRYYTKHDPRSRHVNKDLTILGNRLNSLIDPIHVVWVGCGSALTPIFTRAVLAMMFAQLPSSIINLSSSYV